MGLEFLWTVLLLPLGWLFVLVIGLRNDLNSTKTLADRAVDEPRARQIARDEVTQMRDDLGQIKADLRELAKEISAAVRDSDARLNGIAMQMLEHKFRRGGEHGDR